MVIIIARKMGIPHMMMTNSRKLRSTHNSTGLIILIQSKSFVTDRECLRESMRLFPTWG
jgi:hypothetical protein